MKVLQILLLVIGLSIVVSGQNVSAYSEKSTLTGNVFDEQGSVITNAKISFTNKSGKTFESLTGENGAFRIELNEGKYKIVVSRLGFATYKLLDYKVAFKTKMHLDFALDVLTIIDTVEVRKQRPRRNNKD
jgi:hypothetical protein